MSFILDALKKSEAERQRQVGPTLLELRVTPPRRRVPIWVLVVGGLLSLNVVLLGVFVLRRPSGAPEAAAPAPAPLITPAPGAALPPSTAAVPALLNPSPAAASPTLGTSPVAPPGVAAPQAALPAPTLTDVDPGPAAAPGAADDSGNPADNEPAVAPGKPGSKNARPAAEPNYAALPSFSEVGGNLPELRLDLHVYADKPAERYALINMHKVHEGDVLPEGARVVAIVREGVAMNYRGQDFILRPQ